MSTYLSNYKHDIFISYAIIDDEPFPGADNGWVTTLIKALKNYLGKYLGCSEAFSLWMEPQARGNTAVTPDTLVQLENSATFVLILSPAYLASEWCRLELNAFLANVDDKAGRIFVVEHNKVDERPARLSDLRGYQFWVADDAGKPRILAMPKPNYDREPEYIQRIDDLARDLVEKLEALKTQIPPDASWLKKETSSLKGQAEISVISPRATVFLAEVTDDLQEHRNQVKRYLEQQNIQVVPDKLYFFPGENAVEQLRETMVADLRQSSLFVQLVSHLNPQRPPGMSSTPQLQYECAQALALPILQWGDSSVIDAESIFLNSAQLLTGSFENFKQYIIQQLDNIEVQREKQRQRQPLPYDVIFINIVPKDKSLADEIGDRLLEQGIGSGMPLLEKAMTPAEKRLELENNLQDCDAVIMLYDKSLDDWLGEQLRLCVRMRTRRELPLKVIAVFNQSPTEKPHLGIKLPNLRFFDCATLTDICCLPNFMQTLQQ